MKPFSKLKTRRSQAPVAEPDTLGLPGLRERKKARLRELIMSTALALYRERGYEGTTVEEICRRVEVSQPTFYNYFPSKESILAEHAMLGFGAPLRVLLGEGVEAGLEARLTRYFKEVARVMTRDKKLWHAIAISGAYNPVRNPGLLQAAEAGTHVLVQVLEQGQKSGELTKIFSAEKLASMLEGIMLRTGIEWGAGYGEGTLEARMGEALRFFMRAARK